MRGESAPLVAATLVFGWGNPGRGDDALGPHCVERLAQLAAQRPDWGQVDFLTDFQLAVEHALDLRGRARVLFIDAALSLPVSCELNAIEAHRDTSFSSHAMSPQALLQVCREIGIAPPPCHLLAIGAANIDLGATLSPLAQANLAQALALADRWLSQPITASP